MDENLKKEEFSYGYIRILASVCGYIVNPGQRAEDNILGIDLHIIDSQNLEDGQAARIYAQVKCTTPKNFHEVESCFKYDLKVRNYNQLIKRSIDLNILIIVLVPENLENWITIYEDKQESLIKGCAYWLSLNGMEETKNTREIRIEIPKNNLLSPVALQKLMADAIERRNKIFGMLEKEDKVE
jgi:ribonuclease HIII